ncbi:RES family NAD+ phosphorylase [Mesorhizobium sp. M0048]|uniref:RES family NAD+ phosphorylase n=2 Tax=Mesorhizobium TaxID=68287 RepID=UPI00333E098A
MELDAEVVADLAIRFQPQHYLRAMRQEYAATPLGMGFGQSRFASPDRSFMVLYIARDLATAIAETIIRDRFEGKSYRMLHLSEIAGWAVSEVSATSPLTAIDVRTTGLLRLGISTDAARAKQQEEGRKLSQALFNGFAVDGILYYSRLTGAECVAVYDRAVAGRLKARRATALERHAELVPALRQLNVRVIRGDLS